MRVSGSATKVTRLNQEVLPLDKAVEAWLRHCEDRGATGTTLAWYKDRIKLFQNYASSNGVNHVQDITYEVCSNFLRHLKETPTKRGGPPSPATLARDV